MPMLNRLTKIAVKPLPRVISPRGRAVADHIIAGSLFAIAAGLWRRNKRAALGALVCGGAELSISLLTDYPGGSRKGIPFHSRKEIDAGLATMMATMPEFLAFKDDAERKLFVAYGAAITVVSALTDFPARPESRRESARRYA